MDRFPSTEDGGVRYRVATPAGELLVRGRGGLIQRHIRYVVLRRVDGRFVTDLGAPDGPSFHETAGSASRAMFHAQLAEGVETLRGEIIVEEHDGEERSGQGSGMIIPLVRGSLTRWRRDGARPRGGRQARPGRAARLVVSWSARSD